MENKRVLTRILMLNNLPEHKQFNVQNTAQVGKVRRELRDLVAAECQSCTRFTFSAGNNASKGKGETESPNRPKDQEASSENRREYDDDTIFSKLLSADLKEEKRPLYRDSALPPAPSSRQSADRGLNGSRPKRRQRTTEIASLENIPQELC